MIYFTDSIDTPAAMKELKELVNQCNSYIAAKRSLKQLPKARLLKKICGYIVKMLRVSGVVVSVYDSYLFY